MWMIILGVLTFFAKVIVVCAVQTFVRWTLPRFRYDQPMKLGWRLLLPASLANILVTGVVWLAIDKAGPGAGQALQIAADVSQAAVAAVLTYLFVRVVIGAFAPLSHPRSLIGS